MGGRQAAKQTPQPRVCDWATSSSITLFITTINSKPETLRWKRIPVIGAEDADPSDYSHLLAIAYGLAFHAGESSEYWLPYEIDEVPRPPQRPAPPEHWWVTGMDGGWKPTQPQVDEK